MGGAILPVSGSFARQRATGVNRAASYRERMLLLGCSFSRSFNNCFCRGGSLVAFEEFALPLGQGLSSGFGVAGCLVVAGDEAFCNSIGDNAGQQRNGADGVVVTRDREINFVGVAV